MSWLYEQPLIIVFVGVAVILALGAAWSASGRKELLFAAAASLVLLIAALVVERLVVTDSEAIRATLAEIARDVKNNDRVALKQHIHPSAASLRQKADAELPNYQLTECRVTKIHLIDVDDLAEPRSAVAEFNIIASGTFKYEGFTGDGTYPRWVRLQMLRDKDNRWKVVDYEHDDPQRMIMNRQ
jgi:low affinity Fe/Cu permease